jgi:MraZ protein
MFLGSYTPSFDVKTRRVALPKKIRDYLKSGEIVLSYGFETCIFGFDSSAWEKESQRQLNEPLNERRSRDLRRFFFATAERIQLDDQGRFVIPGNLLSYAKVTEPVIVGAGDHFEIWDKNIWQEELNKISKQ